MSSSSRYAQRGKKSGVKGSGMSGRLPGAARKRSGSESPATAREVDLHLPSGKGSPESLERQLARLRGELNSAIRAGEKEIVFIHGVGTGIGCCPHQFDGPLKRLAMIRRHFGDDICRMTGSDLSACDIHVPMGVADRRRRIISRTGASGLLVSEVM